MNYKQKAKELVDEFEDLLGHSDLNVCHTGDLDKETTITAKQCALICVDEIINLGFLYPGRDHEKIQECQEYYWQGVKQELEKL